MQRSTLELHIANGLTGYQIAEKEGLSQTTIRYWLRKYGLKTGFEVGRKPPLQKWDWAAVQKAYDEGAVQDSLCVMFGFSIATLAKARRLGLFKSRTLSEANKLAHKNGSFDYAVYRTPEYRRKAAKNGGYKPGSGCGKGAWASNIVGQPFYLQSSFEIRMAILLNKASILWERPQGFPYTLDGTEHRYYPDFWLPAFNVYLDTKNDYLIKMHAPKIEAVKAQVKIVLHIISDKQISASYLEDLIPEAKVQLDKIELLPQDWEIFRVPKPRRKYVPRPPSVRGARKTKMPEKVVLADLIWQAPLTVIAARFDVSDATVQKWLKKLEIAKPPHAYWTRRHSGWSHEEALHPRPKQQTIPRKLTDEQFRTIRARIASGEKLLPLAREYHVCHKTMRDIRDGLRYKHLL